MSRNSASTSNLNSRTADQRFVESVTSFAIANFSNDAALLEKFLITAPIRILDKPSLLFEAMKTEFSPYELSKLSSPPNGTTNLTANLTALSKQEQDHKILNLYLKNLEQIQNSLSEKIRQEAEIGSSSGAQESKAGFESPIPPSNISPDNAESFINHAEKAFVVLRDITDKNPELVFDNPNFAGIVYDNAAKGKKAISVTEKNVEGQKRKKRNIADEFCYYGDVVKSKKRLATNYIYQGHGVLTYSDGSVYEGSFKDDQANGQGVLTMINGDFYDGKFLNDLFNRQGIYHFADGRRYEGSWKDGKKDGHGTLTYLDGDVYEGEFLNDLFNDQGVLTYKNGDVYRGNFSNGKMNGKGVLNFTNGCSYNGYFSNSLVSGYGIFVWPNGKKYRGNFSSDQSKPTIFESFKINSKGSFVDENNRVIDDYNFREPKYLTEVFADHCQRIVTNNQTPNTTTRVGEKRQLEGEQTRNKDIINYISQDRVFIIYHDGRRYEGSYKDDQPNGQGVLRITNGDKYEGDFLNGTFHGQGKYTFRNSNVYEGQFLNDLFNGKGIYRFADGRRYEGSWKDGKKDGPGVLTYLGGDVYVGIFKDDEPNGQGVLTMTNGDLYNGEFLNGSFHGHGIWRFADGRRYEGSWKDGKKDGHGTLTYLDGDVYVGIFKDDEPNGKGILKMTNGNLYNGEFLNGLFHGHGTCHFANDQIYEGSWKDGKRNGRGAFVYFSGSVYEGEFLDDHFHGKGRYTYGLSNTFKSYEGEFLNSKFHGQGVFNFTNGCSCSGRFVDSIMNGDGIFSWPNGKKYMGHFFCDQTKPTIFESFKVDSKGWLLDENNNVITNYDFPEPHFLTEIFGRYFQEIVATSQTPNTTTRVGEKRQLESENPSNKRQK